MDGNPTTYVDLVDEAEKARGSDWPRAAALAADLRHRFPGDPAGYRIGSAAALATQEFDAANAIVAAAASRFPGKSWPLSAAARNAIAVGDVAEAIRLAAELPSQFPGELGGYRLHVAYLRHADRLDEAASVVAAAARRFPAESWPAGEAAILTTLRANRAAAARLLENVAGSKFPAPSRNRRRKVVVVLGMHRSGTSLCARIVQRLGIELGGPLVGPSYDNPTGFYEHVGIFEQHQKLLESADLSWDAIWSVRPELAGSWRSEPVNAARDGLKRIVAQELAKADGVWAVKDPRVIRFLPLWREIFDELDVRPIWLLSVREPSAVAASLLARNAIPPELGELLWLEHYLDAFRHLGPQIARIVHFEKWFSDPLPQLQELAAIVGGATPGVIDDVDRLVRDELRHHDGAAAETSFDLARQFYARLKADDRDLIGLQRLAEEMWNYLLARAA